MRTTTTRRLAVLATAVLLPALATATAGTAGAASAPHGQLCGRFCFATGIAVDAKDAYVPANFNQIYVISTSAATVTKVIEPKPSSIAMLGVTLVLVDATHVFVAGGGGDGPSGSVTMLSKATGKVLVVTGSNLGTGNRHFYGDIVSMVETPGVVWAADQTHHSLHGDCDRRP